MPKSIGKRLSELSRNKETCEKPVPSYIDALKKGGFKEILMYIPKTTTNDILDKKQRKRKIISFNPPYSVNVKTNIGKIFLSLLKKKFPKKEQVTKDFQ